MIDQDKKQSFHPLRAVTALVVLIFLTSPIVEEATTWAWQKFMIDEPTRFTSKRHYVTQATERLPNFDGNLFNEVVSLLRHLPQNVKLAASEYGYIGSQHPNITIIDLVGLHDRHIARRGFSADYLFSRMPDIIWFPHPDYSYVIKEILDSNVFVKKYDFYPGAYVYGLAVRRDSKSSEKVYEVLENEFKRLYSGRVMSDYRGKPF